jgi:hypothetical protein
MGATISQPVLFAIWAALAAGSVAMRIPLSLAACTVVFFASTIKQWNLVTRNNSLPAGQDLIMELAFFGLSLAIMLVARWFFGWRISRTGKIASGNANQFSLKYLILLTTICAALFLAGRSLLAGDFWSQSAFWKQTISDGLTFVGLFLFALFPLLIIPLIAIARHPSFRTLIAMPFLCAGLTWLIVEILAAQHGEPRVDVARQLALIQGGALVAGLLSAIALRLAGYRLFSNNR